MNNKIYYVQSEKDLQLLFPLEAEMKLPIGAQIHLQNSIALSSELHIDVPVQFHLHEHALLTNGYLKVLKHACDQSGFYLEIC